MQRGRNLLKRLRDRLEDALDAYDVRIRKLERQLVVFLDNPGGIALVLALIALRIGILVALVVFIVSFWPAT